MPSIRYGAKGDDVDITRNLVDIPVGATVTDAWLVAKLAETDPTDIFKKHITTANTADGQVTDTDDQDGLATLLFRVSAADTLAIGNVPVFYQIQVRSSSGKTKTFEYGTFGPLYPDLITD